MGQCLEISKQQLGEGTLQMRNLEQLAKEEWSKIPVERCNKRIHGYRKRLISVIFSQGCATKY